MFKRRQKKALVERLRSWFWPKGGFGRVASYHWLKLQRLQSTPGRTARGFACGIFASFTPFVGLHLLVTFGLAFLLRGSFLAAVVGTFIGNPLTFPIIWLSSHQLGSFILGRSSGPAAEGSAPDFEADMNVWGQLFSGQSVNGLWDNIMLPMLVGGVPMGLFAATVFYFMSYKAVESYQNRRRAKMEEKRQALLAEAQAQPPSVALAE